MAAREGGRVNRWSDILIQVRTRKGGLTAEWNYRIWLQKNKQKQGKRYRLVYFGKRKLLRYAKRDERDEVIRVREQLDALIEVHKKIRRAEAKLGKLGLLAFEEDILMDFVPTRSPVRVVSKGGTDAGDD